MKRYRLIISDFAESDLKMAADWYASQKAGLDLDFIEEIGKQFNEYKVIHDYFRLLESKSGCPLLSGFLMVFISTSRVISLTYLLFSILAETLKFCGND